MIEGGKFSNIREQLKAEYINRITAGEFSPGDKIETVRDMSKKYGVSHVTAASVQKRLAEEGWLENHVGRGSFVASVLPHKPNTSTLSSHPKSQTNRTRIYFIHCFSEITEVHNYHYEILCAIQDQLKNSCLNVVPYALTHNDDMTQIKEDKQACGVILSYTFLEERDIIYEKIKMLSLPIVKYGMSPDELNCNYVMPDNYGMGILAGQRLLSQKYYHVQFVTAVSTNNPRNAFYDQIHFKTRYQGLLEVYNAFGITIPPPIQWHIEHAECRQRLSELLGKVREKRQDAPTALVVGNQAMAMELMYLAEMAHVKVPEDIGVITFENRRLKADKGVRITTIDFNKNTMGRLIIQLLQYLWQNPEDGSLKYMAPGYIIEGDTLRQQK